MKGFTPFPFAAGIWQPVVVSISLLLLTSLTGCWTPPNASVQPTGEPRIVQSNISGELFHDHATVRTIDADQQLLGLELADGSSLVCHISPQVRTPRPLQPGDRIKVTLNETLTFYVLKDGRLPGAGGSNEVIDCFAKVQSVDTSYRLMTLQYPSGQTTVLKAVLGTKLEQIQPGDSVKLDLAEAIKIHLENP